MLIPRELLTLVYGDAAKQSIAKFAELRDWCGTLPPEFLRVFPVNGDGIPSVLRGLNPPSTGSTEPPKKFKYDRKQFDRFNFELNYKRAVRLLEECYDLKDTYKELDRQIITADLDAQTLTMGLSVGRLEDEALSDSFATLTNIIEPRIVEGEGECWHTVSGDEDRQNANRNRALELAKYHRNLKKSSLETVQSFRATAGNSFRTHEKRIRVKAKYFQCLVELLSYLEALRHGMDELFGEQPHYALIDPVEVDRVVGFYELRPGIAPEIGVLADFLAINSFERLIIDTPFNLEKADQVRSHFRALYLVDLASSPYPDKPQLEFVSDVTAMTKDSEAARKLVAQAYARKAKYGQQLRADIEIENDVRVLLLKISETLRHFDRSNEESIAVFPLGDLLKHTFGEAEAGQAWEKALNGEIIEVRFPEDERTLGNRILGLGGEIIIATSRKYKAWGPKKKRVRHYEAIHFGQEGRIGHLDIEQAVQEELPRRSSFPINTAFLNRHALSTQGSSPRFFGENTLKNLSLTENSWKLSLKTGINAKYVHNLLIYVHVRSGFENHA